MMMSIKKLLKIRMKHIIGWYKNTTQEGLKNSVRKWEEHEREYLKRERGKKKGNSMKHR
jgi:biotin-(acetyl-CoA carboxylase) ligase